MRMSQAKFDSAQDDELCYCVKCDATTIEDGSGCQECQSNTFGLEEAVDLEYIEVSTVDDAVYGDEDEEDDDYDGGSFL